ncbi:MAG TPA: hypothetical protein VGM56_22955, partial [Byssovorax sp.]
MLLRLGIMHGAVEFQREPMGRAIEVDDEACDDLLPAALQTQHASIAEESPSLRLRCPRRAPEAARQFELPPVDSGAHGHGPGPSPLALRTTFGTATTV